MARKELSWGLGICLLDGPQTLEQLKVSVEISPFRSAAQPAFPSRIARHGRYQKRLADDLAELIQAGWVVQQGDNYALTDLGRAEVSRFSANAQAWIQTASQKLRSLFTPQAASKVTLTVQTVLALIKLPAGLISGSVGLLNDSFDTILDLVSSVLVYLGIRFNRERLVSIFLVAFMLITGGFTMYEAVHRILVPYVPEVDWFPFAAALISALAGLGLWTYQRYIGIHSGSMPFIAESVDSRNHVFVALAVTAGLVASLLNFGLLDMLVGLAVAALILWSAISLALDLLRSSPEKPLDLTRYGFWLHGAYEKSLQSYLRRNMLLLLDCGEARTRDELAAILRRDVDFSANPWMKAAGLDHPLVSVGTIDAGIDELIAGGWVVDQTPLALTSKGKSLIERRRRQGHKR